MLLILNFEKIHVIYEIGIDTFLIDICLIESTICMSHIVNHYVTKCHVLKYYEMSHFWMHWISSKDVGCLGAHKNVYNEICHILWR